MKFQLFIFMALVSSLVCASDMTFKKGNLSLSDGKKINLGKMWHGSKSKLISKGSWIISNPQKGIELIAKSNLSLDPRLKKLNHKKFTEKHCEQTSRLLKNMKKESFSKVVVNNKTPYCLIKYKNTYSTWNLQALISTKLGKKHYKVHALNFVVPEKSISDFEKELKSKLKEIK